MQLYRFLSKRHNAVHGQKFIEFHHEWHSRMHKKSTQTTQRLCANRQVRQGTAQTPCRAYNREKLLNTVFYQSLDARASPRSVI